MKNCLGILFLTLLCSISGFAQAPLLEPAPGYFINGIKPEEGALRSDGVIWSEDFANGIPSSWTQEANPSGAVWEYRGPTTNPNNSAGTRGSCLAAGTPFGQPIDSPTADNGFIIFDSNFWDDNIGPCGNFGAGEVPGPHFTSLTTSAIDLSGYNSIGLRFNQYCKNFQANTRIEYSIDGGEWDLLWVNDVPLNSGESARNRFDRINVSEELGDQSNVRLRFIYDGNYYFWMLDDIAIFEIFENNLIIDDATYGNYIPFNPIGSGWQDMEYSQYPADMAPRVLFRARTLNWGSTTQTNSRLEADLVNELTQDTVYSNASPSTNLVPDAVHTFTAPPFQLDGTMAPYSVHFKVTQDQEDSEPTANHVIRTFEVNDVTYARDRLSTEGIFVPSGALVGPQYELGNFYQITADDQVAESISIGVGIGSDPMAQVYGRIYKLSFTNAGITADIVAETGLYGVTQGSFNNVGDNNVMTLPLNEHVALTKDSAYLVVAGAPGGANSVLFPVSGDSPDYSSMARFYPNSWFYFVRTPLVRVNFGPVVDVVEQKPTPPLDMFCFPNPARETLNLAIHLPEAANAEFTIYDQTGRIVLNQAFGTRAPGDYNEVVHVGGLPAGWYIGSLRAGQHTRNEMIMITR